MSTESKLDEGIYPYDAFPEETIDFSLADMPLPEPVIDAGNGVVDAELSFLDAASPTGVAPTLEINDRTILLTPGDPFNLHGIVHNEDHDALQGGWSVTSNTVEGVDCSQIITNSTLDHVNLYLSGREDPRCSDDLTLTWKVSDGEWIIERNIDIHVIDRHHRIFEFRESLDNPIFELPSCPHWSCKGRMSPTLEYSPNGELTLWFMSPTHEEKRYRMGRSIEERRDVWHLDGPPVEGFTDEPSEGWDDFIRYPSVTWDQVNERWEMWYVGYRSDARLSTGLGIAYSRDYEGSTWDRLNDPIYRGEYGYDEVVITLSAPILGSDGLWRLYYLGAPYAPEHGGGIVGLNVLVSADRINWRRLPFDPVRVHTASGFVPLGICAKFFGGRYVIWTTSIVRAEQGLYFTKIGVITSEDGFIWEEESRDALNYSYFLRSENYGYTSASVVVQEDGNLIMAVSGRAFLTNETGEMNPGDHRIGLFYSD